MSRRALIAATLTTAGAVALAGGAGAAATRVTVQDSRFKPDVVQVAVGAPVQWTWAEGNRETHNVREDNMMFTSGPPTSSGDPYKRIFSAGTFYYFCDVHGFASPKMDGFVKVPVKVGAAPTGVAFTVTWATSSTNTGSKYDVLYRVGSSKWKTWKSDASATSAVFGGKGSPVSVVAGQKYAFRARSKAGRAVSRWSPLRSFQP